MDGDDNLAFDHQDPLPSPRSDPSAAAGANNRWNPTRDQIEMLENFYRQGIRTPSAEQIQQITSRLRTFGHIEGKNVFYWFQNHKARLRQKQKQESAYLNRFFHRARPPPILPPPPPPLQFPHPCPNVMYSPYYMPVHGELGFYQQSPYPNKLPLPGGAKRRPKTPKLDKRRTPTACRAGAEYDPMPSPTICDVVTNKLVGECENETLPLFPLQPTGILEQGRETQKASGGSSDAVATYVEKFEENANGDDQQPFYDFFSGGQG